jgi:hypothetical protein
MNMKKFTFLFIALLLWFVSHGKNTEIQGLESIPGNDLRESYSGCDAGAINGQAAVCRLASGIIYSIAPVPGATSYTWTPPPGAVISTGQGTTLITLNFPAGSSSGNLTVTATCSGGSGTPSSLTITVLGPTISGNNAVCKNDIETYTTEPGMTSYYWLFTGAVKIAGGGVADNFITLQWIAAGIRWVQVTYTNGSCTSSAQMIVNVNIINPTITGTSASCVNTTDTYVTDPGMSNYTWVVSSGGTIIGPDNSDQVAVHWNSSGVQQVQVGYTSPYCTISPIPVNVTINDQPAPTLNGPVSVCVNATGNTYTTEPGMNDYIWFVSPGGMITGGGGTGNSSITIKWTTPGAKVVSVNYTNAFGCTASSPVQYNVMVNPSVGIPVFILGTSSTRCQGIGTVTYTATASDNTGINYTLDAASITAGNSINPATGTVVFTNGWFGVSIITATATGCNGPTSAAHTVTTYKKPTVNPVASASYCNGASTAPITFSGPVPGTTFSWTNNNTSIGLGPSGTGNIPSFTATNTGTSTLSALIIVTPTANGCPGNPWTFMISVYPSPNVFAAPASQTICSSSYIYTINFSSNVTGTNFNWTRDNVTTVTGIPASGSGSVFGSLTNTTNVPVTVTFTITPVANGCSGAPTTATVLVNPKPNAAAAPVSQTICSASSISTIIVTGTLPGTTFNWTRNNVATVTGIPASGSGDISGTLTNTTFAPVTVTFTIIPVAGSCSGTPVTATVLVNPAPNVSASPASQAICSPGAIITIVLSGSVPGTSFGWTRDNVSTVTGIAASGTGNINGTLTNTIFAPVTVTFTITPAANGCTGTPITATVLVNPKPDAVAAPVSQQICTANPITTIVLTGNIAGTMFNWTRDNIATVTGIPANGTGDISGTLTNMTLSPVTVTFTIIPTVNGCNGLPVASTVMVSPVPTVNPVGDMTYCAGTTTTPVTFSGNVSGITYNWTNSNPAIGLAPSGTGDIPSFMATNPGLSPISGTITVTPSMIGCTGTDMSFTITVDPMIVPTITGYTSMCQGGTPLYYTTEPGMNNYNWTVSPGNSIINGQGTNIAGVVWNSSGVQWISVSYASPGGCATSPQAQLNVFVEPLPGPAGTITGPSGLCGGSAGVVYSTAPIYYANTYIWQLPAGAFITAGSGTNVITVTFDPLAQSGNITVHGNNICGNGAGSAPFELDVYPAPDTAGVITGPSEVCQSESGLVYTVPPIINANGYAWSLPPGADIVAGFNTRTVTVDFSASAVSGMITVVGTDSCGNGAPGPEFAVTVSPVPPTPVVTVINEYILHSDATTGNQWYFQGAPITGATGQEYTADQSGEYWCVVTINGCSSDTSNHIWIVMQGIEPNPAGTEVAVYPVPNNGQFVASIRSSSPEAITIKIYNHLGMIIYEARNIEVNGRTERSIDLRPASPGIYTVVFGNKSWRLTKRIMINQ